MCIYRTPLAFCILLGISARGIESTNADEQPLAIDEKTVPDSGWKNLFNGQDLSGWTFDVLDGSAPDSIWSVEDGLLTSRGKGKSRGVIRTAGEYSDYELEFEWRWLGEPGNSGCLIHCSSAREWNVWPKSLEIQLYHGHAGDFVFIGETIETPEDQIPTGDIQKWEVRRRYNLTDDSERPAGEWNHMRIRADSNEVTVHVNGDLVNRGNKGSAFQGAICLQAEGANLQFRRIRIRSTSTEPQK